MKISSDFVLHKNVLPGPTDWVPSAGTIIKENQRCVLIFVSEHKGSTPRETGTWLISADSLNIGTLGGGEIERSAISVAQDMLGGREDFKRCLKNFNLGPDLGQCCGGVMAALFEPIDATASEWLARANEIILAGKQACVVFPISNPVEKPQIFEAGSLKKHDKAGDVHIQKLVDQRPKVVLYGAGHVGRAVASVSANLPIRLSIVDGRKHELDQVPLGNNIKKIHSENPVSHAQELLDTDGVLVMTHSHGLDYRLCDALLEDQALKYIGLIGSKTKAARFRNALKLGGKQPEQLLKLVCPIGTAGPEGKEPGIIALSVLSEILKTLQAVQN